MVLNLTTTELRRVASFELLHENVIARSVNPLAARGLKTGDLAPDGPSFITRVCGSGFHIRRRWFGQGRRARSPQFAQASLVSRSPQDRFQNNTRFKRDLFVELDNLIVCQSRATVRYTLTNRRWIRGAMDSQVSIPSPWLVEVKRSCTQRIFQSARNTGSKTKVSVRVSSDHGRCRCPTWPLLLTRDIEFAGFIESFSTNSNSIPKCPIVW